MAENNEKTAHFNEPEEGIELANVIDTDAVIDPGTVVVISVDAGLANKAVVLVFLLVSTFCAERNFQVHQRLTRYFLRMFSQQKDKKYHR